MSQSHSLLKWKRTDESTLVLQDAQKTTYATLVYKGRAYGARPHFWKVILPGVYARGRAANPVTGKIVAKREVVQQLAHTDEERRVTSVLNFCRDNGMENPTLTKEEVHGWMLRGEGRDKKGHPLCWSLAEQLGIWRGAGSGPQCQVDLTKLVIPE